MARSTNNVWLHRFACLLALTTLALVALGGVVTTKGVGMAVPDWPTTYGEHMFLFPYSKWLGGVFEEHSHRYLGSIVGILVAILAVWVWVRDTSGRIRWSGIIGIVAGVGLVGVRTPMVFVAVACLCVGVIAWAIPRAIRDQRRLRWLAVIAFAAVIIQGVLGGMRVLLDEHGWGTELGIFHAVLAQLFFLLLCSIALLTSQWWTNFNARELDSVAAWSVRRLFIATTFLILVQLIFGATMRHQHAGLAVPDFPLAYGKVWPATDAASVQFYNAHRMEAAGEQPITAPHIVVHMLHRFTGVILLFAIIGCAVVAWKRTTAGSLLRKVAGLWVAMAMVQVTLGILSILFQRKVDVTTAHVALGALTFATGWMLVLITSRFVAQTAPAIARDAALSPTSAFKPA